jgi:hypothetical protein
MRTPYNTLIGKTEHGDYIFLETLFRHADNFNGATGWTLTPISADQHEDLTSIDALKDRFREIWQHQAHNGQTEQSLAEFAQWVYDIDGDESIFDFSYYEHWEQLREHGLTEDEYPVFDCHSCGRVFGDSLVLVEVYNAELLKLIEDAENIQIKVQALDE